MNRHPAGRTFNTDEPPTLATRIVRILLGLYIIAVAVGGAAAGWAFIFYAATR